MRGRYLFRKSPGAQAHHVFVTDWALSFCLAFAICSLCFLSSLGLMGEGFTSSKFGNVRNMCDVPGLRDLVVMWLSLWRDRLANLSTGEGRRILGTGIQTVQCSSYPGSCFSRLLKAICCFSFVLCCGTFPQLICTVQVFCLFTV